MFGQQEGEAEFVVCLSYPKYSILPCKAMLLLISSRSQRRWDRMVRQASFHSCAQTQRVSTGYIFWGRRDGPFVTGSNAEWPFRALSQSVDRESHRLTPHNRAIFPEMSNSCCYTDIHPERKNGARKIVYVFICLCVYVCVCFDFPFESKFRPIFD